MSGIATHAGHYSLRHRVIAWVSRTFFQNVQYTVRHGLLKGMKRRGGLGFLPSLLTRNVDSLPEAKFMASLDLHGMVAYDVGAFEGLLTLHFSRTATRVVAFEPNQVSRGRLKANLALNGVSNATVRPVGLSSSPGVALLTYDALMPGGASMEPAIVAQMHAAGSAPSVSNRIELSTLDAEVAGGLQPPDFIKIDVEGLEADVIRGASQVIASTKPALYIELHGADMAAKQRGVEAIRQLLCSLNAYQIVHIESGKLLSCAEEGWPIRGHLYCVAPNGPDPALAFRK